MADEKPPGRKSPPDGWKHSEMSLDSGLGLNSHRRSTRPHDNPGDANAFYQRIFEEAPAPIIVLLPDFTVADANIAAQRLLQRNLSDLRGSNFRRHVGDSEQGGLTDILREITEGSGHVSRPLNLKPRDFRGVEVSVTASMLRDDKGEAEFILLTIIETGKDITEDML